MIKEKLAIYIMTKPNTNINDILSGNIISIEKGKRK